MHYLSIGILLKALTRAQEIVVDGILHVEISLAYAEAHVGLGAAVIVASTAL